MKILALDQSTTKTGWSVFIDKIYVRSGLLDHHKNKDADSRFKDMYEDIHDLIVREKPEIVVFEDTQMQSGNGAAYKILCNLQGTIIGICYALGIKFKILSPTTWRRLLGYKQGSRVKRAELKEQSRNFVKKVFDVEFSEDENEAIAINAAFHRLGENKDIDLEN